MRVRDVEKRVDAIREIADDDEIAHMRQDELYRDVLAAISLGERNAAALAAAALKVGDIKFGRWYA